MTLYVSDLDGTLLDSNANISYTSKSILNDLIKDNINFTIATARTPATVVDIMSGIDINFPIITMNGSAIYDISTLKYIYNNSMDFKLVSTIYPLIKQCNLNAFVYTLKNDYLYVYHQKLVNPYQIKFYEDRKNSSFKTFIEGDFTSVDEILYFTIMDSKENVDALYELIKEIKGLYIVKYKDVYSNIYNLEIYSEKSSKANAIKYMMDQYNFSNLITFGDNLNDLPMFNISDECFAVSNAVPELKEVATAIILSNNEDAVAKCIKQKSTS